MKTKIVKKLVQRKPKPIYTPEQNQISEMMKFLRESERSDFDLTIEDIPLQDIALICAGIWGCSPTVFTSKTNHKDSTNKFQKETFFYAAYYFSNESAEVVLKYACYSGGELFNRSKYLTNHLVNIWKDAAFIIDILKALLLRCPRRLSNLLKFELLEACTAKIPPKDGREIPVRDLAWFNNSEGRTIYIYRANNEYTGQLKIQPHITGASHPSPFFIQRGRLMAAQASGYRFDLAQKEITLESLKGKPKDYGSTLNLTKYQISRIPIREISWFKLTDTAKSFYIYSTIEKGMHLLCHSFFADAEILFKLQEQGYRFIDQKDEIQGFKYFNNGHPICDRCLHSNNCDSKRNNWFGREAGYVAEKFSCFEEVPTDPLKAPLELLYPLEKHQLQ